MLGRSIALEVLTNMENIEFEPKANEHSLDGAAQRTDLSGFTQLELDPFESTPANDFSR